MITSFKGRSIDYSKPVLVYRNLHKRVFSIRQNGKVVGHTTHLALVSAEFIVNKKGQDRVRATGHKNVHAFIKGKISLKGTMGTLPEDETMLPAKVTYNPYKNDSFVVENLIKDTLEIKAATGVIINTRGVTAAYCVTRRINNGRSAGRSS